MQATARQIDANRENAQHSTGPRTEKGKAASSRNNLRHGLTAAGLIVHPDQAEAFALHEAGLRTSLHPSGALQEVLFTRALECSWNLHRCRLAESALHSETGIDPLQDDQNSAKYDRIQKYARQYECSMYKALRALESARRDEPRPKTSSIDRYLDSLTARHTELASNWKPPSDTSAPVESPSIPAVDDSAPVHPTELFRQIRD